uniref:Uncharacterized protein n=1 Tax=Flavobacterium columnare TaxID=996 RepID=A0AA94EYN3_9FLAO
MRPSTSNKDKGKALQSRYYYRFQSFEVYVYSLGRSDKQRKVVDWLYEAYRYLTINQVDTKRIWIENNSLQDPSMKGHLPLIYKIAEQYGFTIPITPDASETG